MCGDFFNTVKKGPGKVILTTIEPPPEFQVCCSDCRSIVKRSIVSISSELKPNFGIYITNQIFSDVKGRTML